MPELKFEVTKKLGAISESSKGWKKELNLVSWDDRKPKADLRDWDEDHKKMGKGITFTKDELIALRDLLNDLEIESLEI